MIYIYLSHLSSFNTKAHLHLLLISLSINININSFSRCTLKIKIKFCYILNNCYLNIYVDIKMFIMLKRIYKIFLNKISCSFSKN